ncbi:hypothetical protein D9619_002338 [Psilocybe cf. subviscida]|uniref:Uncharacterized protein n=1 Tax=Psilocybe cf. subviscida TaxID=2480587 RepID=A0A8H5AYF5_9AGAR|nr:hypothetical protein D9619_002338 [Psilocybe cf. subviscida]
MITKKRGFPLWIPSPNTSLPPEYRYSGVSIGDVGVLTPDGGFDFIFNVFDDASDPINANSGLTDTFSPLRPPLQLHEIQRFKQNTAGTLMGDDSFERTDSPPKVIITTTASEAAVLMMPEDVYAVKMQNQERLRAYISAHVVTWYDFVRRTLGRDISNGDLRVVCGYRKSAAFGIAAISTAKKPTQTRLTFCKSEEWARESGYKYQWSQVGSADVKTGPEYEESAELMYPVYGTSRKLPENQCLFISTLDAKLSEEAWNSMESLPALAVDATRREFSPSSSLQPERHLNQGLNHDGSSSGEFSSAASPARSPAMQSSSSKSSEASSIDEITNPEACISIVCDNNWEDYMECQDPYEFVSAILRQSRIVVENNVVYIDSSPPSDSQTHNPFNTVNEVYARPYSSNPLEDGAPLQGNRGPNASDPPSSSVLSSLSPLLTRLSVSPTIRRFDAGPLFAGASDITISGGTFATVNNSGTFVNNMNSNNVVDSYNNHSMATYNSNNNNSRQYIGGGSNIQNKNSPPRPRNYPPTLAIPANMTPGGDGGRATRHERAQATLTPTSHKREHDEETMPVFSDDHIPKKEEMAGQKRRGDSWNNSTDYPDDSSPPVYDYHGLSPTPGANITHYGKSGSYLSNAGPMHGAPRPMKHHRYGNVHNMNVKSPYSDSFSAEYHAEADDEDQEEEGKGTHRVTRQWKGEEKRTTLSTAFGV